MAQEDIIKELKNKNNKLRAELNSINTDLIKQEETYTNKLDILEEKQKNYADLQKQLNNLIKDGEKTSQLLNNKTEELSEIKYKIQKIKSKNEKRKMEEKNYKLKINKVKDANKYMSSFIQENSVQETNNSILNTKQNRIKLTTEEINNDFNSNNKKELIKNESALSNIIKQTQNEIVMTGQITSNNSMLLNNKEINANEQSKLNEQEDYNMKEISGIMKSILED